MSFQHPLVRRVTDEGWVSTADYVPDGEGIELDARDETFTQTLINSEMIPGADVVLALSKKAPGQYHIRHYHPTGSEIYYVIKGSMTMILGEDEFIAEQGTAIFIPPGTVHATKNHTDEICEMVIVCGGPTYASLGLVYTE